MAASLIWFAVNVDRLQLDTRFPALLNWEDFNGNFNTERVVGSGVLKEENRTVRAFNRIRIEAGGVAEITQGQADSQDSLSVSADENLLPYLISEVRAGELRIFVKPGVSLAPKQAIRYKISVNNLAGLDVSGSSEAGMSGLSGEQFSVQASGLGKITLDGVQVTRLVVKSSGSGSIEVSGQTEGLEADMSGSSRLVAEDLQSQVAKVHISGSGEALVWVMNSLEARLSGSASLRYYGAPVTSQNTSGSASVQGLGQK
jgi:Putative auto-transporter adhesin, head GIN domain